MTDVGQTFETHGILLTGGNGFLGKVVLGVLLDRFPRLKHIYLLLRPKWNLSADVLINCAGLVDFFPPVDESFRSNVDGVRHMVALAKQLSARLAHVSTCFVCGESDGLVEETQPIPGYYPRRKGPGDSSFQHEDEIAYAKDRIRQIYDSAGEAGKPKELARRLTDLGRQRAEHWGWVNTYTYAKSLGEQVLAAEKGLNFAIIRPAIIESALRFPFPGWIEGGRTSAPLVLMARGGMKHWPVRKDAPLEVVPVDLVASALLVVTALLLSGRHELVYQLGTADVNPIFLEPLVELLAGEVRFVSREQARGRRVRLQKGIGRAQTVLAGVKKALETTGLPGKQSLASWSVSLRTRGLQASLREQTLNQYLPFILHNRYIFESENIRAAYAQISEADRRLLPWDPERIEWEGYWLNNQVKGIEKWIQPQAVKEWAFKI
ncbi:MAG: SDR family oxidoreductase [Acidobacteria bacterium]|nr:SDR family oxidoreductase [Acidobacteriota bacterium]